MAEINILSLLLIVLAINLCIQFFVKSIDEEDNLERLLMSKTKDKKLHKKAMDLYLQKKMKILFVKSLISSIIIAGFVKYQYDIMPSSEKIVKSGGCACDLNKTVLPF